ncbi:BLUF domain-containing protein [Lacinutrix chionoecetis]
MASKNDKIKNYLKTYASQLGASYGEHDGISKLVLNNKQGEGCITSFEMNKAISVKIYNITFNKNQTFSYSEVYDDSICFLYCVNGHVFHEFNDDIKQRKFGRMENVILYSSNNHKSIIKLPASIRIKMTVLVVSRHLDKQLENTTKQLSAISQLVAAINQDHSSNYFAEINPLTNKFAKFLVENKRMDAVGYLKVESAVVNTLASQIENYYRYKNKALNNINLSHAELNAISKIGDYVLENIDTTLKVEDVSQQFGISGRKLQSGIQFLYGQTLTNFIRDIKLERAKELIQFTNMNISEICYSIGFNNKSYFTKTFSKRFGIVPVKYKDSVIREDFIFELSYKSSAVTNLSALDINTIVSSARANNLKLKITGCLVFYEDLFFQILEGRKEDVLELYECIKRDKRHYNVTLLSKRVSLKRKFPSWSMAAISDRGEINIPLDGKPYMLNLNNIIDDEEITNNKTMLFWKRVHNIIRDLEEEKINSEVLM